MTDPTSIVKGIKVLDPRDGQMRHSNDPALHLLDLARQQRGPVPEQLDFFKRMADWRDKERFAHNGAPRDWADVFEGAR